MDSSQPDAVAGCAGCLSESNADAADSQPGKKMNDNRHQSMNQKLAPGLRVRKSAIDGQGCFAAIAFRQDQRIAEYVGEKINCAEAERRQRESGKKCVCDIDTEWSIDGSLGGNGTQFINHSCDPNAYLINSRGRLFLYALRDIVMAEEITAEYLYELELDLRICCCRNQRSAEPSSISRMFINRSSKLNTHRLFSVR